MTPFVAELLGTALIIIFGDGVVANVLLNNSKGNNGNGNACSKFVTFYSAPCQHKRVLNSHILGFQNKGRTD